VGYEARGDKRVTGQAIDPGDDERVTGTARCEGLSQSPPVTIRAKRP